MILQMFKKNVEVMRANVTGIHLFDRHKLLVSYKDQEQEEFDLDTTTFTDIYLLNNEGKTIKILLRKK